MNGKVLFSRGAASQKGGDPSVSRSFGNEAVNLGSRIPEYYRHRHEYQGRETILACTGRQGYILGRSKGNSVTRRDLDLEEGSKFENIDYE
ncbi:MULTISPECIES: hypothetical protein [Paenibacillus]|uniref:hypothetical protein n=1 Tax=Paenibacillus TaxID=44249 RepID=UPI002FE20D9D